MHLFVDHSENSSVDQDFARFTSPAARAGLGSVAVLAAIATAVLYRNGTLPGLIGMACAGALLTLTHLGMQGQAAILVLRDGLWLPAVLAAAICVATLSALYLLAFHHAAGWYLVSVATLATLAYAFELSFTHSRCCRANTSSTP